MKIKMIVPVFFRKNVSVFKIFSMALMFFMMLAVGASLHASSPESAYLSPDNDKIFWFVIISDIHIGAHGYAGSQNLDWFLSQGRAVINPLFIVNAGDLTDSTNWDTDIIPDGPHQLEWDAYNDIVNARLDNVDDIAFYYDLPGNHDHYSDEIFSNYLTYSFQGSNTGQLQFSWELEPFGPGLEKYHFLGVNTCGNDGIEFSTAPPYFGDNAGLDATELDFINTELSANTDSDLTMIFGHHAIDTRSLDYTDWALRDVEEWTETALRFGADEFVYLMENYNVLMYGYGHSHIPREEFFARDMSTGVMYLNVASLTKSESDNYNIVAVDCNGISTTSHYLGIWPAVIITSPLDKNLGMRNNPYTSAVTDLSEGGIPIRALVFDEVPVTSVEYRMYQVLDSGGEFVLRGVDELGGLLEGLSIWRPMTQVDSSHVNYPYLWEAQGEAPFAGGTYTIEVRATGSTTQTDTIPTAFPSVLIDDNNNKWCFITAASPHDHASGAKK